MSRTLDTNILVYASDPTSPFYEGAMDVIEDVSRGPSLLYMFWPVLLGYLRVATSRVVFREPIPLEDAVGNVRQMLSLPNVQTPGELDGFWQIYETVTATIGVRGNLVHDAHIVALMHQHGVGTIITADRDFRKFDGIEVVDPFA